MSIEVERTKLLKRAPWNQFTSANLTEFVRLGLLPESRKEHRRGILAWESEETIVRLGLISEYYDTTTKYQYGFAFFAMLLGINGYGPIRWTSELVDKLNTLLVKGTESIKNLGQETYPGLYAAYNGDLASDTEFDNPIKGFAAMVPFAALRTVFPLIRGWDSLDDGFKEFIQHDSPAILNDAQKIFRKLSGQSLGKWLGNPEGRLTETQRNLAPEAMVQTLDLILSAIEDSEDLVQSYSESDWVQLFRTLPMVKALIAPFMPVRIKKSDILPMVMSCTMGADVMRRLIISNVVEQAPSPESSLFPEWGRRVSQIHDNYRTKYLSPWADNSESPKRHAAKETQTPERRREVQ